MLQTITESVALDATKTGTGRIRIKIIDAGEGSSGDYPANTIEQAVKEGIFTKGLHMYADHPGANESYDRPERTIRDLAAVLDTDAVYVPEESAAYAEAKVFPQWREVIEEMADDIGVSIRASAEVEDKDGKRTITRLLHAESVDFVTKAGRGGKITEVLESAMAATRAVQRHGVEEATANELREWLRAAVSAAYPRTEDEYRYAWVQDFDEALVWYEVEQSNTGTKLYQQGYTVAGNTVTLDGDPVEVRVETRYVPVSADPEPAAESTPKDSPSNPAGVTENRKGSTVTTTNIEESELSALRESASRATALEADNKVLRQTTAESIVSEAFAGIEAPRTTARIVESFTAAGSTMTPDELRAEATESAAEWKAAHGEGTVAGVGDTTAVIESKPRTDDDIISALNGEAK